MATTGQRELVKVKGWARLIITSRLQEHSIGFPGLSPAVSTLINPQFFFDNALASTMSTLKSSLYLGQSVDPPL